MKLTTGRGCFVTIMEERGGRSFRGCPLGSGTTIIGAMHDFVNRGQSEFCGQGRLTVDRLEIVRTNDYRKGS